jgi:hypothetical protein
VCNSGVFRFYPDILLSESHAVDQVVYNKRSCSGKVALRIVTILPVQPSLDDGAILILLTQVLKVESNSKLKRSRSTTQPKAKSMFALNLPRLLTRRWNVEAILVTG